MPEAARPTVTIAIPTRNRATILAKCLAALPDGVVGCPVPDVVVVDDCSTDDTAKTVEGFRQSSGWTVHCLRQERPLGANAARNAALDTIRSDIVVLIDDDAIVTRGWLVALLGALSPETQVVTGAIQLNLEGPIVGRHRSEISAYLSEVLEAPRGEHGETVPVACNMAAYREMFDRARFDNSVRPPCEEGDWIRRVGATVEFVPDARVLHYKTAEEMCLRRVLRLAWLRGGEGGWWVRERSQIPPGERSLLLRAALKTAARSFGHAAWERCWGGVVVGVGELSRALALAGLIKRGLRAPESWR